jgi:hypothetical protein
MDIEKELQNIKERNARVEADKAWEMSLCRKGLVLATTYIVVSLVLYSLGTPDFYLGAIIPTIGFFLSTLTFSFIKHWWVARYVKK